MTKTEVAINRRIQFLENKVKELEDENKSLRTLLYKYEKIVSTILKKEQ